ncbi:YkgJ family cysteine cluster protein [Iodobacter ciconiae]|nr:YkgJ family cysteine cluster protein [Iodobacter ciconiae]
MARLPRKSVAEQTHALENLSCPHLADKGCTVYLERPLICRLFGTTPALACPHGKQPEMMIDKAIEQQIYQFFKETRQVLV